MTSIMCVSISTDLVADQCYELVAVLLLYIKRVKEFVMSE